MQTTARTIEYPDRQGYFLPMSTLAARLRCVGRVDFDKRSASFFRFAGQLSKERRPGRVTYAFRKTMVMNHSVHVEILNTNEAKLIDNLARVLVCEVLASPPCTFMYAGNGLTVLLPLTASLDQFRVLALDFRQSLFGFSEETRVVDLFAGRESSKGLEPNVNADLV